MGCHCCDCQPQVFSRNISTSIAIRIWPDPIQSLGWFILEKYLLNSALWELAAVDLKKNVDLTSGTI